MTHQDVASVRGHFAGAPKGESHPSPAARIERLVAHPLRAELRDVQRTSQASYAAVEIVVVEVHGSDGLVGIGECLARRGAGAYARFIEEVLAPVVVGRSAFDRRAVWQACRAQLTGRPGGQIVEAIAGIDIALWDLVGKACGQPIHRLLGGIGRDAVPAYASSINWADDARAEREIADALAAGFREIKVKIGRPARAAIGRAALARKAAGEQVTLYADANWAYDLHEAIEVAKGLHDQGFAFFEEPLAPHDRTGYERLSRLVPIRIAAGESDFTADDTRPFLEDRSLGLVQPDVARSGGISETWRIAELAAVYHTAFAPHVGWSGAICEAAGLHLAAAAQTTLTMERMVFANPLREDLCHVVSGAPIRLADGKLGVPTGPGLGIALDRDVLNALRVG